jgi:hypothetical protein
MGVSVEVPKPRKHEVIEDVWFGEEGTGDGPYVFTAPPTGTVLSAFLLNEGSQTQWYDVIAAKLEWLREGFDEETWDHLVERMEDPTDPFDSNVMAAMHDALVQELARRPFTSSSASTPTRSRSTGAAARKRKGATSGT